MPISKASIEAMEMLGLDTGQFAGTKYLICVYRYRQWLPTGE